MKLQKFLFLGLVFGSALILVACTKSMESTSSPTPTSAQHDQNSHSMTHEMSVTSEKEFIQLMIPHHQEAIDTSKLVASKTSDAELKKFTSDVVTVQTNEVEQMKQWLKAWYQEEYVTNTAYQPMMGDLTQLTGVELDKAYIEGMIFHHQGAIQMAKQVLELKPRPEIEKMANDIISVQTTEVKTLQGWLSSKGHTQH